ncbi:MAG: thymidylate kinase [Ruminococcaceae bacterium]|nr:thymidylate kinase [Oscillospiraceae bacterium]
MGKGKIIVLEGMDGCGKSTQLQLIVDALKEKGLPARLVSFPNYDSDSGRIIKSYLNGDIPCDGTVGAYAASSFYAADRYISFNTEWKDAYERGDVIFCGRYTTSNAIYQMTKLESGERDSFLAWLWDHEYKKLGLPKPDKVFFLDMPLDVSQKLLTMRYNGDETKKDVHERDLEFLKRCRENALYTAKRCGWELIECSENGEPLSIDVIHQRILSITEELINV